MIHNKVSSLSATFYVYQICKSHDQFFLKRLKLANIKCIDYNLICDNWMITLLMTYSFWQVIIIKLEMLDHEPLIWYKYNSLWLLSLIKTEYNYILTVTRIHWWAMMWNREGNSEQNCYTL